MLFVKIFLTAKIKKVAKGAIRDSIEPNHDSDEPGRQILDTIDHTMFGFFCQGFFVGKLWVKLWANCG